MSFSSITRYEKVDILIGKMYNNLQPLGFEKTKTECEMIDIAVKNGCSIITKNGRNGKWYVKGYLKGKRIPNEDLKAKLEKNKGNSNARNGVYLLLIEYPEPRQIEPLNQSG